MNEDRWHTLQELFHTALQRAPEDRDAFLDERCGADIALRHEIRLLFAREGSDQDFVDSPPSHLARELLSVAERGPGTTIGRYEIISMVGGGGMGEVYRARDPRLGRDVAVKIMRVHVRDDATLVRRFEQEARAAAALNHPHVLAVHDVGVHDAQPYLVSELLEGTSLRELIGKTLPIQKAVQYAIDACHGLAAAHDRGIVHRDLKPENLFVTRDGCVKILDFGLAKLMEAPQSHSEPGTRTALTSPNVIMGTPGYMSPEQVAGRTVDHRSDIFSLGAVLYELLTGRRAFAGDSVAETVSAILKDDPAVPASTDAVSAGVFTLVRHCLAKDAAQRFQSARDLAFALATVVSAGHGRERARAHASTAIASAGPQRLIVLPFENLSPHGQEEWLAGALADSLTFGLRNVENIIIVNRQHAGVLTDPQQLFETLAVRYCVKGSFQRVGDELKAFVRLIHADTGTVAVQESLTDHFSNLLSLEETIATRFAAAFERAHGAAPATRHTSSLAAYKRLSQGREFHLTGRYAEAAHHLEIAVRQDAESADAWALLANSYARLASPATSDDDARMAFQRKTLAAARRAAGLNPSLYEAQIALALAYRGIDVELWRTAALKAMELNPRLAEAYVLLGQSYFSSPAWGCARHRDSELAERYFRKGLQIDPRFGLGHNALIYHLRWAGRPTEALQGAEEAIRLLPDHMDLLRARAMTLMQLGRLDEAAEQFAQMALEPTDSVQDEWALAAIDLLRGRFEPGDARLDASIARGPRVLRNLDTALVYCHVGNFARAATHLRAACAEDPACATFVEQCPAFAGHRHHAEIVSALLASPRSSRENDSPEPEPGIDPASHDRLQS